MTDILPRVAKRVFSAIEKNWRGLSMLDFTSSRKLDALLVYDGALDTHYDRASAAARRRHIARRLGAPMPMSAGPLASPSPLFSRSPRPEETCAQRAAIIGWCAARPYSIASGSRRLRLRFVPSPTRRTDLCTVDDEQSEYYMFRAVACCLEARSSCCWHTLGAAGTFMKFSRPRCAIRRRRRNNGAVMTATIRFD